ncbi:hypothetical protein MHBO_005285 [Bonamia ostreae]|uniref:Uncharacterized protein n=1 Tax=Bonamia ostreae TaxID=126728 RepID=A0ABV2AFM0_9EUKA
MFGTIKLKIEMDHLIFILLSVLFVICCFLILYMISHRQNFLLVNSFGEKFLINLIQNDKILRKECISKFERREVTEYEIRHAMHKAFHLFLEVKNLEEHVKQSNAYTFDKYEKKITEKLPKYTSSCVNFVKKLTRYIIVKNRSRELIKGLLY